MSISTSPNATGSADFPPTLLDRVREACRETESWSGYLYSPDTFSVQLQTMRHTLPVGPEIFIAMKANPHECFLTAAKEGHAEGVEIASLGEGERARAAGWSGDQLIFSGPGKTEAELNWALENNVSLIHLESLIEAHRLSALCIQHDIIQNVLVRVNPAFECTEAGENFGGSASKMGVDQEALASQLSTFLALPNLNVCGIHMYAASNVVSADTMLGMVERVFRFVGQTERAVPNFRANVINLGGGFGVDYSGADQHFDMAAFGLGLQELLFRYDLAGRRIVFEPGRWLSAQAGWYATTITDIKISRGRKQVICTGGANHFRRPAAMGSNHPCQVVPMSRPRIHDAQIDVSREKVDVSGPLCTTMDRIGHDVQLDAAAIGDVLVFSLAGAYGLTMSPSAFLSHSLPDEIVLGGRLAVD